MTRCRVSQDKSRTKEALPWIKRTRKPGGEPGAVAVLDDVGLLPKLAAFRSEAA